MASKYAAAASRKKSPIDLPLAAMMGLAVGFVVFVMPADLISSAVQKTGLSSVLPMAAPPLGTTARALIALAGAGGTFAAIFLLLRMLGGGGSASAPRLETSAEGHKGHTEDMDSAPRLRRADIHPDAPARRPILAARELGEPAPQPAAASAPFWRPEDFPAEPEAEIVEEPEPEAAPEPEAPVAEPQLDELVLGPDIEILPPSPPIEVAAPPAAVAPEPIPDDATIPDLVARLERGLQRRLRQKAYAVPTAADAIPPAPPAPAPAAFEGDDRLRSAIENLQKMAARAG